MSDRDDVMEVDIDGDRKRSLIFERLNTLHMAASTESIKLDSKGN